MAKTYHVKNVGGGTRLPITDGTLSTFNQIGDDINIGTENLMGKRKR